MSRDELGTELCQDCANLPERTQISKWLHRGGEMPQDDDRYLPFCKIIDEWAAAAGENCWGVSSRLQSDREITDVDLGAANGVGSRHDQGDPHAGTFRDVDGTISGTICPGGPKGEKYTAQWALKKSWSGSARKNPETQLQS
jgi:hypothetical protein